MADTDPVNFNRRSADLIGRTIKEFRGQGRGELPLPKRRRGVPGGGGGISEITTTFGIVVETAGENATTIGYYVPLNTDLEPIVIVDPTDPDYDAGEVDGAKLGFYSGHQYTSCPAFERIQVYSMHVPLSDPPETKRFGLLTDCVAELSTRTGFGSAKVLFVPEGGGEPDDIGWYAGECS